MYEILRFPGFLSRALTFSYDDGTVHDERLVGIFNKNRIKATFNLNSGMYGEGRRMAREDMISLLRDSEHEVAVHGVRHRTLTYLSDDELRLEVLGDKEAHESDYGKPVTGLAYPYGKNDERVRQALASLGISYARAGGPSMNLGMPTNRLAWQPTCHHSNGAAPTLARELVEEESDSPRLLYLWGHSYEFADKDNWGVIEEISEYLGGRGEIYYATNGEIDSYLSAFERLERLAGGGLRNSTGRDIYLSVKGKSILLRDGEETEI